MSKVTIHSGGDAIETTTEEMETAAEQLRKLPEQSKALANFVTRFREIQAERDEVLQPIKEQLEELRIQVEASGSGMGVIKSASKVMDMIAEKGIENYHANLAQIGNALDSLGVPSGIQYDLFGRYVSRSQKEAREANKASKQFGDTKGNA